MDQIFQNVTVKQNVYLCNLLVHSLGSIKAEIALNLSLANIRVTACLLCYSHNLKTKIYVIKSVKVAVQQNIYSVMLHWSF